jgi:putative hydrolase of the HAD superfamily
VNSIRLNDFENIIFDLGNVIIDLDIEATDRGFKAIFKDKYDEVFNSLNERCVFNRYEKGEITSAEFIQTIKAFHPVISEKQIVDAWNAMLLNIPRGRFEILEQLKGKHRTFCLSNTNHIHIDWINKYLESGFNLKDLNPFFEKVYYSHLIGMRKPDVEIFDFVLNQNDLDPKKTLFIDDTKGHLEGAEKLGIKTYHMTPNRSIEKLFEGY